MRSILTLTTAALIAASVLSPVSAATHHKRAPMPAPVQSGYNDSSALQTEAVAARPGVPAVVYDQPFACFTDEGYGRFASCDQAGN